MNNRIFDWSFDIDENNAYPIAQVCKNVSHGGYNFAKEIVINKIIIEVGNQPNGGNPITLALKFADFENFQFPDFPYGDAFAIKDFPYLVKGVVYKCQTKPNILPTGGNGEELPLFIWYGITVGSYDKNPPHEFTGGLRAARFMPNIRFATNNPAILSVRVDYKFHFDVDSYLGDSLFKRLWEKAEDFYKKDTYCAIIQDADSFPDTIINLVKAFNEANAIFSDLDKIHAYLKKYPYDNDNNFLKQSKLKIVMRYAGESELVVTITSPIEGAREFKININKIDKNGAGLLNSVAGFSEDNTVLFVSNILKEINRLIYGSNNAGELKNMFIQYYFTDDKRTLLFGRVNFEIVSIMLVNYLIRLIKIGVVISVELEKVVNDIVIPSIDIEKIFPKAEDIAGIVSSYFKADRPVSILGNEAYKMFLKANGQVMNAVGFSSAEKPVLLEMVGDFVKNAESGYDRNTWDNLHLWGSDKLPSTPGAFHAIHSHFHWSNFLSYPRPGEGDVIKFLNKRLGQKTDDGDKNLGLPQWRSGIASFKELNLSGPLISPKIPYQHIQFAITEFDGDLCKKIENLTTETFKEIADAIKGTPKSIAKIGRVQNTGSDLVYWLSCKADRYVDEANRNSPQLENLFEGIFFVNGFYFAHNIELQFSLTEETNAFAATQDVDIQKPKRSNSDRVFREVIKKMEPKEDVFLRDE